LAFNLFFEVEKLDTEVTELKKKSVNLFTLNIFDFRA
jgi:hypothetical protein